MSFCENCGRTLPDNSSVCPNCPSPTHQGGAVAAAAIPASGGLSPTAAGALSYLAGFITGIIFLVIDPFKTDRFVRFHAFQSIFFNVAWDRVLDRLDDSWDGARCDHEGAFLPH